MFSTDYKFGEVKQLSSQVESSDKVEFKNIFGNINGGVSILAFKAGQGLTEHQAPAEVMVYIVEGEIDFTMIDRVHNMKAGDFLLMGNGVLHSVAAKKDSKVMLVKVKAE